MLINSCRGCAIKSSDAADLLYVLARDNESEHICELIAEHTELLRTLARRAVECGEPDAKWQLAVAIGESRLTDAVDLLRPFLTDPDEYVRRRSLMVYAAFSPVEAEEIALRNLDDDYEYTRLAALSVLDMIQSTHLEDAMRRLGAGPS